MKKFGLNTTAEDFLNLFESSSYAPMAENLREQYASGDPYPHIVIDNFVPNEIAVELSTCYPDQTKNPVGFKDHANVNVSRKFWDDSTYFEPALKLFSWAINSRSLILFLETLTGIESLVSDPYFTGGGAMSSGKNDFLNIHADFNWHYKLQAHRRINLLLYLTPEWDKDWGGDLVLWDSKKNIPVKSIKPLFNRAVIFSVTDDAYHGQPKPLDCPIDVRRNVFSSFYYTTRRDEDEWNDPHFTKYLPENSEYALELLEKYRAKKNNDS